MKKYEVILEYKTWIFRRRKTVRVRTSDESQAKAMARFLFWARTGKNSKAISARPIEDEETQ